MTGYSRDQFGLSWADVDRNGCDTRNDILGAQLRRLTHRPGTHDCVVLSGQLADPYSGRIVPFRRGPGDLIDIDHVVSLGDAWQTGAQRLTPVAREALANDPLNLLAVDASSNREKGDSDAASWLPAKTGFRCAYVARQVAVKTRYRLYVTPPERDAIHRVLARCPGQRLPTGGLSSVAGTPLPAVVAARNPTPAKQARKRKAPARDRAASYANCAAARAAGVAPLYRGSPGYSTRLDGDHDGVACE